MITPDRKLVIHAPVGKLPLEEADLKVKVNIMIVDGREILKKILLVHSGVTILQIQAADLNQVGLIITGEILIQVEDKVHRTGQITLLAVRLAPQTVVPEACHLAAHLLVQVVVVDRVQEVGINFKNVYV